jgi:hypothetical protein
MAKAKTKPATKAAHKAPGCKKTLISFTNKRGTVIEFKGNAGKSCTPRTERVINPKTGRLKRVWHKAKPKAPPAAFRKTFAAQAKECSGNERPAFIKCMRRLKGAMPVG